MLGNLILEVCNAPGTGPLTLAGAPQGRQTFVSYFPAGTRCFYGITDGVQTEEGWTTIAATFARNVIWNSAGTTSPLNFSGACTVYNTLPAQRALWADEASIYNAQGRRLANVALGATSNDAARLDQVGAVREQTVIPVGGAMLIPLPILGGEPNQLFEIDIRSLVTSGDSALYFRLSTDGANSFHTGASDYFWSVSILRAGVATGAEQNSSFAQLTGTQTANFATQGKIRFDPTAAQWDSTITGAFQGSYVRAFSSGNAPASLNPTHMVIGAVNQNITSGIARVSRVSF